MLRNPPSLFGGWDSDRPRAVAATLKGITGIGGCGPHANPRVRGYNGIGDSELRLPTTTVCRLPSVLG